MDGPGIRIDFFGRGGVWRLLGRGISRRVGDIIASEGGLLGCCGFGFGFSFGCGWRDVWLWLVGGGWYTLSGWAMRGYAGLFAGFLRAFLLRGLVFNIFFLIYFCVVVEMWFIFVNCCCALLLQQIDTW